MKKLLFILLSSLCFVSCISQKPKDFTLLYDAENTKIEEQINIEGYYQFQRGCDTTLYTLIMFYSDGLFVSTTTAEKTVEPELVNCFVNGGNSAICKYPLWGTYSIIDDTIKTQAVKIMGIGSCTIFRDFIMSSKGDLYNINDYLYPENTNFGDMKKYPSFFSNLCPQKALFVPMASKQNSNNCPWINKKWFRKNKK